MADYEEEGVYTVDDEEGDARGTAGEGNTAMYDTISKLSSPHARIGSIGLMTYNSSLRQHRPWGG